MDQERPLKGSRLSVRGEHQFLDLLHDPKAVMVHARSTESKKRSFCSAVTSCFPVVPRLQRGSSLSKMKVMNEQESEQGFRMVLMFTRASADS